MKYFGSCQTAEECKSLYRKLAKQFHPDSPAGSAEKFREMKEEFEQVYERLKTTHRNKDGETYQRRNEKTQTATEFMDIIDKVLSMGLSIELCGTWLWVTGDTKPFKEQLKELGFHWSSKKVAWYYTTDAYNPKAKGNYSMDTIRNMWGSEKFEREQRNETQVCTV